MSLTAVQASAYLHHLHVGSEQPRQLAAFYADVLDMRADLLPEYGHVLRGPRRRLLISDAPAKKLLHAGFSLRDAEGLEGLRARAKQQGLVPVDFHTPFFKSDAFCVTDPDGNVIAFGLSADEQCSERHIRGPLQHLTLASARIEAIENFYADKLGFAVSDRVLTDDGKLMTSFMRGNHEHHNLACFFQHRIGMDHHSYEAGEWDTIRDWCDHFAGKGVQLMWGPGRHGPGNNLFVFIVDPDGNWIEISAELEVIHGRPVKHWLHEERTLNKWGRGILRTEA